MTALPVLTDIYRVTVNQLFNGQPLANVMHFQGLTAPPAIQVAQAVGKAWGSASGISLLQHNSVLYQNVTVTPLDGTSTTVSDPFSTAANTNGQGVGTANTGNVARAVAIKSTHRGRTSNGRIYIGGTTTLDTTDKIHWTTSTVGNTLAAVISFATQLSAGVPSLELGVASYGTDHSPPTFFPFDHFVVNPVIASQRMRLRN